MKSLQQYFTTSSRDYPRIKFKGFHSKTFLAYFQKHLDEILLKYPKAFLENMFPRIPLYSLSKILSENIIGNPLLKMSRNFFRKFSRHSFLRFFSAFFRKFHQCLFRNLSMISNKFSFVNLGIVSAISSGFPLEILHRTSSRGFDMIWFNGFNKNSFRYFSIRNSWQ